MANQETINTALAVQRQNTSLTETDRESMFRVAETVIRSGLAPQKFNKNPAAVFVAMLYGRELGISEIQSVKEVNVINGMPSISANLMLARIKKYCPKAKLKKLESTPTVCRFSVRREPDDEPEEVSYTIEEARLAGLLGKDNWRKHPADMLFARCISRIYRQYFPDLSNGIIYTADEAEEASSDATPADDAGVFEDKTTGSTAKRMPKRGDAKPAQQPEPDPGQAAEAEADAAADVVIEALQDEVLNSDANTAPEQQEETGEDFDALLDLETQLSEIDDRNQIELAYDKFRDKFKEEPKTLISAYKIYARRLAAVNSSEGEK